MADVFGRPHLLGWYDPTKTPNIIIENNCPKLVDVGLARLSKLPGVGVIHDQRLDLSIRKLLLEK